MGVPGVTMHQIGIDSCAVEIGAATDGSEYRPQWFRTSKLCGIDFVPLDGEVALLKVLIAETADIDRHQFGQLARQILHMNASAAVSIRWVFVGKQKGFQAGGVLECWSEATTESLSLHHSITPSLHYSITPLLLVSP